MDKINNFIGQDPDSKVLRCVLLRNRSLEVAYVNPEFDPKDFHIPDYILVPGSEAKAVSHVSECPVIVFINSKSDGQLGLVAHKDGLLLHSFILLPRI